ncbi:hypothetical protein [Sphingosinicella rhizophila]|uniref:Uncharacterized protein n=1 Tax=Sphingosinicella rhizophila TaxID=3050082 RepID=A0ABU3Q8W6_9SPHN|nr:hypothetical protein [Sphingosinicella sp. GR2756]MDT9599855.1 hypothetical protein [Sphingosinicella sp. GR2756]
MDPVEIGGSQFVMSLRNFTLLRLLRQGDFRFGTAFQIIRFFLRHFGRQLPLQMREINLPE